MPNLVEEEIREDRSPEDNIKYLILSAPHSFMRVRLARVLNEAGLNPMPCDLGLRVDCAPVKPGEPSWQDHLTAALDNLKAPERRDVRIAMVELPAGPAAEARGLFSSRSAIDTLARLKNRWIEDVLADDQFSVLFHALVLDGREVYGHECLLRGVGNEGETIAPQRLFDAARSTDQLFQLDQKARIAAVRAAAESGCGPEGRFFINFLAAAIYDPETSLKSTLAAIAEAGLRPSQFCFEVVESAQMTDRDHVKDILAYYRHEGFQVALDDFGSGNTSLTSLSDLRPDYIKLAPELVRRAPLSAFEGRIVKETASAARAEGITVIAEGIETRQQLAWVHDVGISLTQGFVWAKPSSTPMLSIPGASSMRRAA